MTTESTFHTSPGEALLVTRPRQLAHMSAKALDTMWRHSEAARVDDLQGEMKVRFVYLRGQEALPDTMKRILRAILFSPLFPLRTKRVTGTHGENRFGLGGGQFSMMRFNVRRDTAWDDGKDVLVLDYDLEENAPFIRPIRDEVCRLEPGLLLGRMGLRVRASTWLSLFFTLERR